MLAHSKSINPDSRKVHALHHRRRHLVAVFALSLLTGLGNMAELSFASGGGGAKEGEAKVEPPTPRGPTRYYVHHWLNFPGFSGRLLTEGDEDELSFVPRKGRMSVIIFTASWCEPCQQIMPKLQLIEKRYKNLPVDFLYVFAHDMADDAEGAIKEYGIQRAVLGNNEILKAYRNPELPTIYVGDRHGWMTNRYQRTTGDQLDELDKLLKLTTAY